MVMPTTSIDTLKQLTDAESIRQIALALGQDPSSFDKKIKRNLSADLVIEIAQAYGIDPVNALKQTGHISGQAEVSVNEKLAQAVALIQQVQNEIKEQRASNVHQLRNNDLINEANTLPAAAQKRTPRLEEPEQP